MELRVNGRRAYAYTGGKTFDPALPCVVFIHGAINDHTVWTLAARWFANHGYGVLALDLPGHMRSEGPPLPNIEALADWTLAVLDAAGVKRAALVGHSMGSLIALEAAGSAPDRVSHLVMVGTAYPMKVSAALLDTARDDPLRAIDMVVSFSISTLATKPSYPSPGVWLHGASRALMRRVQAHDGSVNLFHHDFGVCDRYANGMEAAARVRCPATLVLGARDQMTQPKQTKALADALKARSVLLPSGHSLMAEVSDALLDALRTALA